jgi:hypothetical protein
MWPFDAAGGPGAGLSAGLSIESLWLALYVVTFALHAVFVSYVAAGAAYAGVAAIRHSASPIAARTRDWLPFMLGAGITAGVGPLLFLQLLYQRRFYTANLLMGPRWGAVVPALIVGFYALYLAKAGERWRRIALAAGTACFGFVAWSWTELHQLMADDPAWRAMYGAGERFHLELAVVPRLALWLGAMPALFATVAAWSATPAERRRLAYLALAGLGVAGAAAAVLIAGHGFDPAHGWGPVTVLAAAVALAGWAVTARRPDGAGLSVTTAAMAAALVAGAVVREAPRLAMIERGRATAVDAGGLAVFVVTLGIGIAAIAWVVRTVRGAAR